jgi:hypothetical protein
MKTKEKDQNIECEKEIEVVYFCPKRGLVKEKVKGVKLKTLTPQDDDDDIIQLLKTEIED